MRPEAFRHLSHIKFAEAFPKGSPSPDPAGAANPLETTCSRAVWRARPDGYSRWSPNACLERVPKCRGLRSLKARPETASGTWFLPFSSLAESFHDHRLWRRCWGSSRETCRNPPRRVRVNPSSSTCFQGFLRRRHHPAREALSEILVCETSGNAAGSTRRNVL